MENQRQKWVNLIFLGCGALVGLVFFVGLTKIFAAYGLEVRIRRSDLVVRGAALAAALITGFGLYFNDRSNAFMNEVVLEMGRVTWPTRQDTTRATFLVVIMVMISGVVLGGFDSLMTWVMQQIF